MVVISRDLQALRILVQNCIHWGLEGDNRFTFDNRETFLTGNGLKLAARALRGLLDQPYDAIACAGFGSVPLAAALKLLLPERIKLCAIRDTRKAYGTKKLIEGPALSAKDRVWIVDDLLNTGKTFEKAAADLRSEYPGVDIVGALVLVDFSTWGSKKLITQGYQVRRVFTLADLNLTTAKATKGHTRLKWKNLAISNNQYECFHSLPSITGSKLIIGTDNTGWTCCDKDTGEIIWALTSRRYRYKPVAAKPLILGDRVVVSAYDGVLRCLGVDTGDVIWQNKIDSFVHSSPQVYGSAIYVGTEGRNRANHHGDIVCLDHQTGNENWRIKTGDMVPCTTRVIPEADRVICASNDRFLYGVSLDGNLKWKVETGQLIRGQPAYSNGRIFTLSHEGLINAYDTDGVLIWSKRLGAGLNHGCPLVYEDSIIVPLREWAVASLDQKTGDIVWFTRQPGRPVYGITPFGQYGFCTTERGHVSKIDLVTGRTLWAERVLRSGLVRQPLVFDPPMIYMVSNTGGLSAFEVTDELDG